MTRAPLPQLSRLFLTDGGLETDLMFNHGLELPGMAAITLLRTAEGRAELDAYFRRYLELARRSGTGFILESASWRASPDWLGQLGLTQAELDALNRDAIATLQALKEQYASPATPIVVSGCIGPRGDGYDPGEIMRPDEAEAYHSRQAATLAAAGADMLCAMTITNVPEAIGIARAARRLDVPLAISFTVETNGRLPTGDALGAAIEAVDEATGAYPAYFMINCAHPSHFEDALLAGGNWVERVRGIRANASRCSHEELDGMETLDDGDPDALAEEYRRLRARFPHLNVLGGCCGTDIRHVAAIADRQMKQEMSNCIQVYQ